MTAHTDYIMTITKALVCTHPDFPEQGPIYCHHLCGHFRINPVTTVPKSDTTLCAMFKHHLEVGGNKQDPYYLRCEDCMKSAVARRDGYGECLSDETQWLAEDVREFAEKMGDV